METTADKVKAVVYAVLVHAVCILLAFSGMFWWQSNKAVQAAGEPIEAVFVDLGSLKPVTAAPPRPRPPQPPRQAPPPPEAPPRPLPTDQTARDLIEQQRIDNLAQLRADEEAREQEERRKRAEQIELEEEQRREREAQQQRQREEQQQREREQREQREQAQREAEAAAEREAAERAAAEAAEQAQRRAGAGGEDTSLLAQYAAAIQRQVTSHWLRPDSTPPGVVCRIRIIQIPGGEVLSANVVDPCNADEMTRRSIEAAVLRAQPLPYTGFESVFNREVIFNFRYQAP